MPDDAETISPTDSDREERLAALLDRLISEHRNHATPDWDALGREHPDLVDELRELWATAMVADDLGELSTASPQEGEAAAETDAAQQPPLPIGHELGDYELLEEIGRGGMGVVYKARQKSLGRTVALKMILGGELASRADLARFRAEAQSAARLNHAHIVPVYEVGEHNGQPYFSMQYVEGTTASRRLADGPLPPREAARLLIPVCRAIAEAHRHSVLHRDLKPSNILIDGEGRPYVTDFGLAKRVRLEGSPPETGEDASARASLTRSGAILGTPGYMAPEQAAGQRGEVGPATDVYSLGAILYAMLAGRPPFQAASAVDTVLMVLEQDPLPPRLLNHRVDADLEMIVLKCLQKPSDLRYPGADALADDLEAYLAHEPVSARSSHISRVISRAFRETHHAALLENWGVLWMWHSLVLLVLCFVTNWFQWQGIESRLPYVGLWGLGLGIWAGIFWELRRRAGPITFVERQIAHVWAGSVVGSILLFVVEALLGMEKVLVLSPVLGLISGMVFLVKAGILSGVFYVQAAVLFLTAVVMAVIPYTNLPDFSVSLFGVVSAACFFVPGLKYYRQRVRASSPSAPE